MDILKKSYLIIALILLVFVGVYFYSNDSEWESFSLNLITEIIGIIITVGLIDYAIRKRAELEKRKVLKAAFIQFKRPTHTLMSILVKIYKASCEAPPSDFKESYRDLFSTDHFYSSIRHLDFKKKALIISKQTWAYYTTHEVNKIKESYDKVIEKYGYILDSTMISEIEWLKDSVFLFHLSSSSQLLDVFAQQSIACNALPHLAHADHIEALKDFLTRLFALIDHFEKQLKEIGGLNYDKGIWSASFGPKVGSGRLEGAKPS